MDRNNVVVCCKRPKETYWNKIGLSNKEMKFHKYEVMWLYTLFSMVD